MIPSTSLPSDAELATLLKPVSESAEAGRDLDGTLELSAFEMTVREPETAPIAGVDWQDERDWRAIERDALALLRTSKDLRIAVQLARARLQTDGLPAFCRVLSFICDLTRSYWPSVYPQLDPESADPTARVNALEELASQAILNQLRRTRLAVAPVLGPVTIKEAIASVSNGSHEQSMHVKAALDALGADSVALHLAHVRAVRGALDQLTTFVLEQSGTRVLLKPLMAAKDERPGVLDALETLFAAACERLSARPDGESQPDAPPVTAGAVGSSPARRGPIASRDDVIATLDRVCAYYSASEPSSPVPLLLRRAQRLVPLDFLSLVQDLAREGLGDLVRNAGLDPAAFPDPQRQAVSDED
jgi:type VI secretion system protein ImpA